MMANRGAEQSLRSRVVGGAISTYGSQVIVLVSQLVYIALVSRVLGPAEYSVYTVALVVGQMASYFCTMAMSQYVMRSGELSDGLVAEARALSLLGSLVTLLISIVAGFLVQAVTGTALLMTSGLLVISACVNAQGAISLAAARRRLLFGRAAAIEAGSTITGLAGGALFCAVSQSPVGLAGGTLTAAIVQLILARALLEGSAITMRRPRSRAAWKFGLSVAFQNAVHYGIYATPAIALAGAYSRSDVGYYGRAQSITNMPMNQLVTIYTRVLYPAFGVLGSTSAGIRRGLSAGTRLAAVLAASIFGLISALSSEIVSILLGPLWHGLAALISSCAVFSAMVFIYSVLGSALEALGRMRDIWRIQAVCSLLTILYLAFVIHLRLGLVEIVLGLASVQAVAVAMQLTYLFRDNAIELVSVLGALVVGLVEFSMLASVPALVRQVCGPIDVSPALVIGASGLVLVGLVIVGHKLPGFGDLVSVLRSLQGRSRKQAGS